MEEILSMEQKLDEIDEQIVRLLDQRLALSEAQEEVKRKNRILTPDTGRERELIAKVTELAGPETKYCAQSVFHAISAADRSRRNAVEAGDSLMDSPSIMFFESFSHVFRAVEAGMCQYGILPIENSTAGSVNAVYDQMLKHNFYIVKSARLKINHFLLSNPGASLDGIREIISHQQAISQCSNFLSTLKNVDVHPVANTAIAAKTVAESGRTDIAAICSASCGEDYGMKVLKENIQDSNGNYTRFICISKNQEIYPGADRISLIIRVPHKPGALYNVLAKFYALGVNIRKLESRPMPDTDFEFEFYFDVESPVYAPETDRLIRDLEKGPETIRYLGAYNEILI